MWSWSDPNITTRVPDLCTCILLRVCYDTLITNLANGYDNIAILFTIKMALRWPWYKLRLVSDEHIYMHIAQLTILTNIDSPDCHDRPHDPLRFNTITTIKTMIVTMNEVYIMISTNHRRMMQIEEWFLLMTGVMRCIGWIGCKFRCCWTHRESGTQNNFQVEFQVKLPADGTNLNERWPRCVI